MYGHTVISVTDPVWANVEQTALNCMVLFKELERLGPVPFTTWNDADTPHGIEVWERASIGEFGAVGPYVPPTPEVVARWMVPPKGVPKLPKIVHFKEEKNA